MIQNRIVFLFVLIAVACSTSHSLLFQPTEAEAAKISSPEKKITLLDLQNGYNLYVSSCAECHSLYVPSSKSKLKWDGILPKMFVKAQLNKEQQELVKLYIYSKL